MISCHPSTCISSYSTQPHFRMDCNIQQYIYCVTPSVDCCVSSLSNYSVHCIFPVDIPTGVSNWSDRSHRHRSNQNLNIRTSSFFTSTTKAYYNINQWLLIWYAILARLALYHLSIPHGDNCRRVFVLIRWLLYMQYPNGWLLYPLPLHLSYLPIPPLIVVYYIAILHHRICHHIPLLHICWLLICYFDTCILIINPYSIHTNYLLQ